MNPSIATLVYVVGIACLFYLDRDKSVRTSRALWLPVIWVWIIGSRPVSFWIGGDLPGNDAAIQALELNGSAPDRIVFQILVVAGMIVIAHRAMRARVLLRNSLPILAYFFYCLVSILWSDFPGVAAKRWIKAVGDLVMVLIVVTDKEPIAALKRFFSRTGFILLPISLLFIKFFPALGRSYDQWIGTQFNVGVTTDKNLLGVITFVLSLGALWRILTLSQRGRVPGRARHLLAQGALLGFGVTLLRMANSATSLASFVVGAGLMLTTLLPLIRRRIAAVHALVLSLLFTAGLTMLLGGQGDVVHALGRDSTLTGRTDIWKDVIPMAPNALIGAGFESFWLGPRLEKMASDFQNLHVTEAHNGYIEVYLQLGLVGLFFIALVVINGYLRSVTTFRRDPILGGILLAIILTGSIYNITEAGFRMMDPMWVFFLLAVVASGGITSGVVAESTTSDAVTERPVRGLATEKWVAARARVRSFRTLLTLNVSFIRSTRATGYALNRSSASLRCQNDLV